ncbi:hypothetical protein BKA67DRAFT_52931 [Truncatella angustata]|uniref:Uncharacterized protein n=1 Tax=Truncatella angustata TaxID=152316 RepID=A0A9P8UY43_9PEZI|nr:uncharacterized protein BKA67DRAFT_52931 [Truncatella angustata]KAH6660477.1 hypothetical protein BKA67DRAFT_52931 [Truncatella angustata]
MLNMENANETMRKYALDTLAKTSSHFKLQMEVLAKEIHDHIESTTHKLASFDQEIAARKGDLRLFAQTWHLRPTDLDQILNDIPAIRPSWPDVLSPTLGPAICFPSSVTASKPRNYAEASSQTDKNILDSLHGPVALGSDMFQTTCHGLEDTYVQDPAAKLLNVPKEGVPRDPRGSITVSGTEYFSRSSSTLHGLPGPDHHESTTRDRTPSAERPFSLIHQVTGRSIDSNRLTAREFPFVVHEFPGIICILRCPCREFYFESNPFKFHEGIKHFYRFHPEICQGEIPTAIFLIENYARKVNGMTSGALNVRIRWLKKGLNGSCKRKMNHKTRLSLLTPYDPTKTSRRRAKPRRQTSNAVPGIRGSLITVVSSADTPSKSQT